MPELIDGSYFSDLSKKNPAEICRNSISFYDRDKECYRISLVNEEYDVYPAKADIIRLRDRQSVSSDFIGLMIIYYLLFAQDIPVKREWISEKDIPGGTLFFTGPHEIPVHLITEKVQEDLSVFKAKCESLQGNPVDMGDAAYHFRVLPRIPVTVVYYLGDDEFPAEAKILFDRTISDHLTLDIIYCLVVVMCRIIGKFE